MSTPKEVWEFGWVHEGTDETDDSNIHSTNWCLCVLIESSVLTMILYHEISYNKSYDTGNKMCQIRVASEGFRLVFSNFLVHLVNIDFPLKVILILLSLNSTELNDNIFLKQDAQLSIY